MGSQDFSFGPLTCTAKVFTQWVTSPVQTRHPKGKKEHLNESSPSLLGVISMKGIDDFWE